MSSRLALWYGSIMSDRLEQLSKLHAANPVDPDLTYMIALEYVKACDPVNAIDWLDRTLDIDIDYLYAYFQKAKALSNRGEHDAARESLKIGIEKAAQCGDAKAQNELSELLATLS